jgi:hypothetical protein
MIELGVKGKDRITGFEGIITGRAQYLTGCNQCVLVPPVNEKGEVRDGQWFDESRIEILGPGFTPAQVASAANPGGPQRDMPC